MMPACAFSRENMKNTDRSCFSTLLSVGFLCLFLLSAVRGQTRYTVNDLGSLGGGDESVALAINARGDVVGITTVPNSDFYHAYIYSGGQMHEITPPGADFSETNSINNRGEVVGYYSVSINGNPDDFINHAFLSSSGKIQELISTFSFASDISNRGDITGSFLISSQSPQDVWHAFLYTRGQLIDLETLGGDFSEGYGINDRGQVVGYSSIAGNSAQHAFLYSGGQMQDLGTLGGLSVALRINENGQIVGYSVVNVVLPPPVGSINVSRAFLYSGGRMIDLGALPGSIQSTANGINNKAEVVGLSYAMYPDGPLDRGFLYSGGTMLDINSLLVPGSGWIVLNAWAINDAGQIAAQGTRNGIYHGLLLNPVAAAKAP